MERCFSSEKCKFGLLGVIIIVQIDCAQSADGLTASQDHWLREQNKPSGVLRH